LVWRFENGRFRIGSRGSGSCIVGCSDTLPNGWRLNCGAELESSQTELYYAECRDVPGFAQDGRRQLQARVRRPTINSIAFLCAH